MKQCTISECSKSVRARGLCATHYNQAHQPNRHKTTLVECAVCGEQTSKQKRGDRRPVCSLICRHYLTWDRWPSSQLPEPYWPRCRLPVGHPARQCQPAPRLFVAGVCAQCHAPFVCASTTGLANFCSATCARRWHRTLDRHRRRLKMKSTPSEPGTSWRAVMRRDGDECYLCGDAVDPTDYTTSDDVWSAGITYPSLDHVIPLSRGGEHTMANAKLAHILCNAWKSDALPAVISA